MSLYEVQRAIYYLNVTDGAIERFRAEPDAVLASYDLAESERRALIDGDAAALWRLGVHPLMMLHFARISGIGHPGLYGQIKPLAGERSLVSVYQTSAAARAAAAK
jgi:hypothetical protein